jgi:hypothetical protein
LQQRTGGWQEQNRLQQQHDKILLSQGKADRIVLINRKISRIFDSQDNFHYNLGIPNYFSYS